MALKAPWTLDPATATFSAGLGVGFRNAAVAAPSGGGGGQHPATGARCPAVFRVAHDDRIGTVQIPAGAYTPTLPSVGPLTCAQASSRLADCWWRRGPRRHLVMPTGGAAPPFAAVELRSGRVRGRKAVPPAATAAVSSYRTQFSSGVLTTRMSQAPMLGRVIDPFFANQEFQYGFEAALGAAYHGAADIGEVLATGSRIVDGDADSWLNEWMATAGTAWAAGRTASSTGRRASALSHFQRAGTYYAAALGQIAYSSEPDRRLDIWRRQRACWERSIDLFRVPGERVAIPYERTSLPAYFFRARMPRPESHVRWSWSTTAATVPRRRCGCWAERRRMIAATTG